METNQINSALARYIKLPWITEEDRIHINAEYGSTLLSLLVEMYSYAANDTVWTTIDFKDAHAETMIRLKAKYPFLSEEGVKKIANMAAYCWK